ncbi:MAG TPA: UbiD family decarboxylase [Pilimelia sp.]|nr:UbiD family decarboxylase [Pilimelia sp.]
MTRALSLRAAVARARPRVRTRPVRRDAVLADFVRRYGGVPATPRPGGEPVVRYPSAGGDAPELLVGAYGDPARVRGWLPGLPARTTPAAARTLLSAARPPVAVARPPCQELVRPVDLAALAVPRATPRDAGPYLTTGIVYAEDPATGARALSVHRMLVLDHTRLVIWMVPGRALRAMHEAARAAGRRLPVSVNLGAPPAAMVASALNTRFLPEGVSKLDVAGGLAAAPVGLAPALSQPTSVLADAEIVLEGHLDDAVADECLDGGPAGSLPEFLGYDGAAQASLPVVTVTAITMRRDAVLHAVPGPGREQSVILGLAGAVSVALSAAEPAWRIVTDLHYAAAGGGMLLLAAAVRKDTARADGELADLARAVFARHPFTKLVVFVDDDVDVSSAEDVLWALTTRANLGTDCTTLTGHRPLGMDPSQRADWASARGQPHPPGRTFIDATVPYALRHRAARSFPTGGR